MSLTKAQKIRRRTLVGGSLALALAGLLWLAYLPVGTWLVFGVGALLALLAALELARMGSLRALRLDAPLLAGLGAAVAFLAWRLSSGGELALPREGAIAWALAALLAAAWSALRREPSARSYAAFAGWLAPALPALALVRADFGASGLVALIVLSKLGDIAGYYVGSAIGKRHPFPLTSPGKTVAGCVASLVTGTAGGAACVALGLLPAGRFGIAGGLLAGALVNLAAQAGDLLESKVKRRAGVKDSGAWFGPSGGLLDLVDSLLLSVPMACLCWPFLFPGA